MSTQTLNCFLILKTAWGNGWSLEGSQGQPLFELKGPVRALSDRRQAERVCHDLNVEALMSLHDSGRHFYLDELFEPQAASTLGLDLDQLDGSWTSPKLNEDQANSLVRHLKVPFYCVREVSAE